MMRVRNQGIRDQFVRIMHQLGGNTGLAYCTSDATSKTVEEVQSVFLSCPLDDWVRAFGQPRHVSRHRELSSGREMDSWEGASPEGAIRCDGHLFERSPGQQWIVVQRLHFPLRGAAKDAG